MQCCSLKVDCFHAHYVFHLAKKTLHYSALDFRLLYFLRPSAKSRLRDCHLARVMATKSEDLGGSDKLSMNTMESKKDISSSTQPHQPSQVDDVPDPEEDDLDDLDGRCLYNLRLYFD